MPPKLSKINVVDVESTCWVDTTPPEGQVSEIIEIGICVLDTSTGTIEDKRSIFVKPIQSEVTDFCTKLTTITPEMLEDGLTLEEGCSILRDEYNSRQRLWVSWGDYDRTQFKKDCARKDIEYPFGKSHLNARILFGLQFGYTKAPGMAKALKRLDFDLEGTHHRGDDDAYNIARILRRMIQ